MFWAPNNSSNLIRRAIRLLPVVVHFLSNNISIHLDPFRVDIQLAEIVLTFLSERNRLSTITRRNLFVVPRCSLVSVTDVKYSYDDECSARCTCICTRIRVLGQQRCFAFFCPRLFDVTRRGSCASLEIRREGWGRLRGRAGRRD